MRSHLRSGATRRLAHRGRTTEPTVCPAKACFRTLITLTGTVARERVPCQRQRCARERPTPPVRRVPDSLPGRGLTPRCAPRCALRAEMSRDAPTFAKNILISNLANARTSEMSEIRPTCPKFAPHARDSCLRAEIRVAKTPSDDEPSHIYHFLSLPPKYLPFFGTLIEIYIYYIFYFLTPPDISASVILDSGTFTDISDVLATAKFELGIFLKIYSSRIWRTLEHRKCP